MGILRPWSGRVPKTLTLGDGLLPQSGFRERGWDAEGSRPDRWYAVFTDDTESRIIQLLVPALSAREGVAFTMNSTRWRAAEEREKEATGHQGQACERCDLNAIAVTHPSALCPHLSNGSMKVLPCLYRWLF